MKPPDGRSRYCPSCQRELRRDERRCPDCGGSAAGQDDTHWSSVAPREADAGSPEFEPEFDPQSLIGEVVGGRYRLERLLGQGAMGAVYRGVQLALTKPYAIKVLLPSLAKDAHFIARFQQEARIAAAIRHPGLVEVFDYGVEDGLAYSVMELLQGKTLAEHVAKDVALPPEVAVRIVAEAADAVAVAHEKGVIHRDLKPANLFLTRGDSGRVVVKVLDFGVSKATIFSPAGHAPMTMSGSVCGTPAYMSPEQGRAGAVDGRTDIYALGVVLYRLLTGKVPFDHPEPVAVMYMHLERPVPSLSLPSGAELPPALVEVVSRALAKRPEDRFATMLEFAQALRSVVEPGAESWGAVSPTASSADRTVALPATAKPISAVEGSGTSSRSSASLSAKASGPPSRPPASSSAKSSGPPSRPPASSKASGASPRVSSTLSGEEHASRSNVWRIGIPAAGALALIGAIAVAFAVRRVPEAPADEAEVPMSPPVSVRAQPPVAKPAVVPPTVPQPTVQTPLDEEVDAPGAEAAPVSPPRPALVLPPPQLPADEATSDVSPRESHDRAAPVGEKPARARGEIALTSKVPGKVVAVVGGARVELYTNSVTRVPVPAGTSQVKFLLPDTGESCAVSVDVLPNLRRALVFGPEPSSVVLRDPSGAKNLNCQSP